MSLRTSRRDAASTIFNLPDYRVIDAVDLPGGGRRITIASTFPQARHGDRRADDLGRFSPDSPAGLVVGWRGA